MRIVLCYSKEVAELPWKVELEDQLIFCKQVNIHVPCKTLVRNDKTPHCVLEMEGDLGWDDRTSTVSIV